MKRPEVVEVINPYSKRKVAIPLEAYSRVKEFIVNSMSQEPEMSMNRLLDLAAEEKYRLYGEETNLLVLLVKQDMMARAEMKQLRRPYRAATPVFVLTQKVKQKAGDSRPTRRS